MGIFGRLLVAASFILAAALAFMWWGIEHANAHDWKNPQLDGWYSSLTSSGGPLGKGVSCCSKEDCHMTDAELRGDHWWARLGIKHVLPNGEPVFEPADWKEVPDEVVNRGPNGNAIPNPAGEAVICHPQVFAGQSFQAEAVPIYCFVPPNQI
jgi:hypothetical protein